MKKNLNKIITLLFILASIFMEAQDSIFTYKAFIQQVKEHHPLAMQANLLEKKGEAKELKGKGGFDPKLEGDFNNKNFKNTEYYNNLNFALKIPSWYGLSFNAGFENNLGEKLNPENYTPSSGLLYGGVNLALGNGFLFDERRAQLKKGKLYAQSGIYERELQYNQLILEASNVYWEWFAAYHKLEVGENALNNSIKRFSVIKRSAILGDKPMIDTLEAWIQVQNRQIKLQTLKLYLQNKKNYLQLYLWQNGSIPLEIKDNIFPEKLNEIEKTPPALFDTSFVLEHPKLLLYGNYVEAKKVDVKLAKEGLKPTLNIKYNPLFTNNLPSDIPGYIGENYKAGAQLVYPIPSRKARGQLRLEKLELKDLEYGYVIQKQQLIQKAKNALNIWENFYTQESQYKNIVSNYKQLLDAEESLFFGGESSFFMINSREKFYLTAQENYIELLKQEKQAIAEFHFQTAKHK